MGEARNTQVMERFAPSGFFDNDALFLGTGKDAGMMYDISDGNAHLLKTDFLAGGATHVPVHVYGVDIFDRDLGFFNGETQPQVALVDVDRDSWIKIGFQADDQPAIQIGGSASTLYLPDIQATEVTIYSAENYLYLTESDQTDPAGRWRFHLNGDILYIERALTASWATDENWLSFDKGNERIAIGKNLFTDRWASSYYNTLIGMLIAHGGGLTGIGNTGYGAQVFWSLTSGHSNVAIGQDAMYAETTGTNNVAVGFKTLFTAAGGYYNTAIGSSATYSSTTGAYNTAIGYLALFSTTTGGGNVAVGSLSMYNATGTNNVAVGHRALYTQAGGGSNIAIGHQAGDNITSGSWNIVIGCDVDVPTAGGSYQIVIGGGTSQGQILGDNLGDMTINALTGKSIHLAVNSVDEYDFSATALDMNSNHLDNTGYIVLNAVTWVTGETGVWNESTGELHLNAVTGKTIVLEIADTAEYTLSATSADFNANTIDDVGTISTTNAAGPSIANEAATSTNPTLIPNRAEMDTGIGWASDTLHIVLGGASYYSFGTTGLTAGSDGAGVADLLFYGTTSGCYIQWDASGDDLIIYGDIYTDRWQSNITNTFVGVGVVTAGNLTGDNNTSLGFNTLYSITSGAHNVAIGSAALPSNTSGSGSIGIGTQALYANTSGARNIAIGFQTMFTNVTGIDSVAVGYSALYTSTGSYNVAVGRSALYSDSTGSNNVAVGYLAAYTTAAGGENVAVGVQSLYLNNNGVQNVAVGLKALYTTTGTGNIGIGYQAGDNITTGHWNTIIGHNVDAPSAIANYQIQIGDGTNQGYLRNDNAGDWTIYSPSGKVIKFQPDGDVDDYVTLDTLSGVPTWYATGSYMRFGDAATTQVSLAAEDDVMVSGKLEVYGITYHTGVVYIGDTNVTAEAVVGITTGIQIDQGGADDAVLVFKSSDVGHDANQADADTFFAIKKNSATGGAVQLMSFVDTNSTVPTSFDVHAYDASNSPDTTKTHLGKAIIELHGYTTGAGGVETQPADTNIFTVKTYIAAAYRSLIIVDSDGDVHATDFVAGLGEGGTTAVTGGELRAPDLAAATNQAGADLTISAGAGTGNGDVGQIIFQTPRVQASGTTVHTKTTILTLDEDLSSFTGNTYLSGIAFIGDSNVTADARAGPTTGIQIDQGASDDAILLFKSSDVAQLYTGSGGAEADTYAVFKKAESGSGGLLIRSFKDSGGVNSQAFVVEAYLSENVDTTKSISGRALIEFYGAQASGTGIADLVADANVFAIRARRATATDTTVLIVDEDGDVHATDFVAGMGEGGTTAVTGGELRAPDLAAASDQAGADLTISAGAGTGNGDVGTIIFQTPRVNVSGTTVHTKTTIMTMDEADINLSGYLVLYNTDTDSAVEGAVWFSETDKNIEFYDGTAVKVVAEVAGISFLPEERVMFDHRWELNDLGLVKIDKIKNDGSPHGLLYPFNQALAEAEEILALKQRVTDLETELAEIRR